MWQARRRSDPFAPGPPGEPRWWSVARCTAQGRPYTDVTRANHNCSTGSLHLEGDTCWIIGPTERGPQPVGAGGEVAAWISKGCEKTWSKQRDITSGSPRNHNYVRWPVDADTSFYAFWADGDPDTFSPSHLYLWSRTTPITPRMYSGRAIVGIGQCRTRHLSAQAQVVQFAAHLTVGTPRCRAGSRGKSVEQRPSPETGPPTTGHALLKLIRGQVIHQLSEDRAAGVHSPFCRPLRSPPQGPFSPSDFHRNSFDRRGPGRGGTGRPAPVPVYLAITGIVVNASGLKRRPSTLIWPLVAVWNSTVPRRCAVATRSSGN